MSDSDFCIKRLRDALSSASLRHALDVVADATAATVVLFDNDGDVVMGPVSSCAFVRALLDTETGRQVVVSAHRAAIGASLSAQWGDTPSLLAASDLDHFAIPVVRDGRRAGTMTLGDRPRLPLSTERVASIAREAGLDLDALAEPARSLTPWTEAEASAACNMAALVAELVAELCVHEQDLRDRIDELTAVYSITGLLAGTLDLEEILHRTAQIVCDVMKVKACSIRLLDPATGNLAIRAVHNLSEEYLGKGEVTVEENPIDAAAIAGEIVHIDDAPSDPRTKYPEQARKEGIVSGMVTGLIYRGDAVGVLRIYTGEPHSFTRFDESLLRAIGSQAAAAIVNARLAADALEAERNARQIAVAGQVQRRMIPSHPPVRDDVEIGAVYRPTFNVGGDLYDFITLDKSNLGIAIADVSGKGVPASLLMASLRSALRVYARFTPDIPAIMSGLNRHVCHETTIGEFITAFYGVLSPDGRSFVYCNAGHDPPMLLRDGAVRYLEEGGMVLGVDEKTTFESATVEFRRGDVLLLYTDGAVEALDFADEAYGRPRLAESLERHAEQPAERVVRNILWDIRRFRGLADRLDDVTLVAIKVC